MQRPAAMIRFAGISLGGKLVLGSEPGPARRYQSQSEVFLGSMRYCSLAQRNSTCGSGTPSRRSPDQHRCKLAYRHARVARWRNSAVVGGSSTGRFLPTEPNQQANDRQDRGRAKENHQELRQSHCPRPIDPHPIGPAATCLPTGCACMMILHQLLMQAHRNDAIDLG